MITYKPNSKFKQLNLQLKRVREKNGVTSFDCIDEEKNIKAIFKMPTETIAMSREDEMKDINDSKVCDVDYIYSHTSYGRTYIFVSALYLESDGTNEVITIYTKGGA
ncbi:hypothetical protein MTQ93_09695 [Staphylococcus agnetis]|uniref:hypothetical protein n=1 Tax=Staphylococcus agnetis TaxID=985762 RepID=UPI00208E06C7|nr:hypothetical protein [Staphylococcus agnetis]MCO4346317.1 hypothetical protein [Staphylococcus agnetis]MCO4360607.1 hypothetical protein [Staphylococcus agnetis]